MSASPLVVHPGGADTVAPRVTTRDRPRTNEENRAMAQARAKGYAAGWSHGMKAAKAAIAAEAEAARAETVHQAALFRAQADSALQALGVATDTLHGVQVPAARDLADTLLLLAVDIAEHIVGQEPQVVSGPGRQALRRALASATDLDVVAVRLNPDDLATLPADQRPEGVRLIGDARIAPGDSVVEHPLGEVEVMLQRAVQRVREELTA